jgi:predicted amidohydrolase YtcJ
MPRRSKPLLLLALSLVVLLCRPARAAEPADLVFKNGVIYTMSAPRIVAEALAIRQGRILYVGASGGIGSYIGKKTTVVDLQGKMVLPGFQDAHVHPLAGGQWISECDQRNATSAADAVEIVRRYALKHPADSWIRGGGWPLPLFQNANPNKELLDKVLSDRPVFLLSQDGHSAWVNSRALALAGITKQTSDPAHGRIERDPQTGEPTGTVREDAMAMVAKLLPAYPPGQRRAWMKQALAEASRFGITSLQDADVTEEMLKLYAELEKRGELNVRVRVAFHTDSAKREAEVPRFKELRAKYNGRLLHTGAIKIFADGVIEAKTAALLEPYSDSKNDRGLPVYTPEALNRFVQALDKEGFQVHVHAIGDRAIRMALDAFETARNANGGRDSRHHIAHLELLDPQDIPRFRALGVAANFQPLWAYADPYIKELTLPILGPRRSRWLYPIRSIVKTGALLVCGSDWPVTSLNPLDAIQIAVTRRDPAVADGPAFIPEEIVDLSTVLAGYTINAAYINFLETETGSLEVGKAADLIVLDRNLFDIAPAEISKVKVLLTLLEGRTVYRDTAFLQKSPQ